MIPSEERRVRVGAARAGRSTVRPKLPSTARPTLPSSLRPVTLPSRRPDFPHPSDAPVARVHPAAVDVYDQESERALSALPLGDDVILTRDGARAKDYVLHDYAYPARPDDREADPSEAISSSSDAWDEIASRQDGIVWEDAAPLRTSAIRRQSRWLYAVSRQILFGTPRQIVAGACVVGALGLLVAGGSVLVPRPGATGNDLSAWREPLSDLPPKHRTKIALSVNIPAAQAPTEVLEPAAAAPAIGAVAPPEPNPPPGEAAAALGDPSQEDRGGLKADLGNPSMPPVGLGGTPADPTTTRLVAFNSAPFPYNGLQPSGRPFLDIEQGGRKGHRTWYGTTLWQEQTFNDNNVLVHVPPSFDPARAGVIVVFFHGYGATLTRDIRDRQQVPTQISASGANAVLLAPQFAVDARDSSAGRFWEPGGFNRFLDEAATNLAKMRGDPALERNFAKMPVVIVAYSGGFLPAAWALKDAAAKNRVRGVVLLDAVYGETDEFANWSINNRSGFLVSAFTRYTQYLNAVLEHKLAGRGVAFATKLDGNLGRGSAVFLATGPDIHHADFVTQAWTANPVQDVLSRLPDISLRDPQTVASIDH